MTHLLPKSQFRLLTQLSAIFAILGLFGATGAAASTYETVGTFGGIPTPQPKGVEWPEDVQLGGVGGLAINRTGAGGVPKGTIYAAVPPTYVNNEISKGELPRAIARYNPDGTFEETFFDPTLPTEGKPARCGPLAPGTPECGSRPDAGNGMVDVDIDQSTGNIYLLYGRPSSGQGVITVFNPNAEVIARFGEKAPGETAAESPGKIHSTSNGGIAVNDSGEVYVYDEDNGTDFYKRLMVFKPETPGDYEHYIYAGAANDIGGTFGDPAPYAPILDDEGNIYAGLESYIVEYDPSVSRTKPVCSFNISTGVYSFAPNPATGEVFYYNYANRKVHLLNPCDEGKFTETEPAFKAVPERGFLDALAFDPTATFGENTPPGVLYGAAAHATNGTGGEPGQSSLGYIFSRPPSLLPVVNSESVANTRTTSATLRAFINPKGSLTSYAFQYISLADWEANEPSGRFAGATEVPVGGGELGSGQTALLASAAVSGLVPAGTYHYRVIATSNQGTATGPDQIFRTYAMVPPGLVDDRAYEQVSPVNKNGGEVISSDASRATCGAECKPGLVGGDLPVVASPDGNSIAYKSQPFRLNTGPIEYDENIARRDASGWQSAGIGSSNTGPGADFAAYGLDSGLSKAIVSFNNSSLTPEAPLGYQNLIAQRIDPLSFDPILRATPPNRSVEGFNGFHLKYAGSSADLSRVFFTADDALTEATPVAPAAQDGGVGQSNLYEWSEGQLRLVNVGPGNVSTTPGATFGAPKPDQYSAERLSHAISSDGSRIFWQNAIGQVYVREDTESTREIPVPGEFLSASANGSKVLLSSGEIYDLETETTTDLTAGEGGFLGLVGQSEELSRVYFVSTAVLDGTPNAHGDSAAPGEDNLYAWNGGTARFVATLHPDDNHNGGFVFGDWTSAPVQRTAQASPDGTVVAFLSAARLTDAEIFGKCVTGFDSEGPCDEVYVYNSRNESLICASCNPVGSVALGRAFLPASQAINGGYLPQARFVTDAGRVYFDSRDSLSPRDTNEGAEDIYEYEPEGVGSCDEAGGCVSLISAGREKSDSNLVTIDATGQNVFFVTRDQLVLKDKDDLIDLYDARENGGFAAETEIARSECQGEACQPPYSPPSDPTPASLNFSGAGNVGENQPDHRQKKKHHKKKHRKHHKKQHAGKISSKHSHGGAK